MLVNTEQDRKAWLSIFNSKFASFCKNSPLVLAFDSTDGHTITIEMFEPEDRKAKIEIDYSVDPTEFIADLKDYMIEKRWYPEVTATHKITRDLSAEEISDLVVNEGLTFEEAVERQHITEKYTTYRIEQVYNDRNAFLIRNLDTDEVIRYAAQIPVSLIMRRIYEGHDATTILLANITPVVRGGE